jgi:hypothetical protein
VSQELRERLVLRFNLFVEYERHGDYDKQFDLLSEDYLASLKSVNVGRDNYVEFKRKICDTLGCLVELRVITAGDLQPSDNERLSIFAGAKLRKDHRTYYQQTRLIAYLKQEDWFFSMWYIKA